MTVVAGIFRVSPCRMLFGEATTRSMAYICLAWPSQVNRGRAFGCFCVAGEAHLGLQQITGGYPVPGTGSNCGSDRLFQEGHQQACERQID